MNSKSPVVPTASGTEPVCPRSPLPLSFLQHKIFALWLVSRCGWGAHSLNTSGDSRCCFSWNRQLCTRSTKHGLVVVTYPNGFWNQICMSRLSLFHLVLLIVQYFVFDPRLFALAKLAYIVYQLLSIPRHPVVVHMRSFSKLMVE